MRIACTSAGAYPAMRHARDERVPRLLGAPSGVDHREAAVKLEQVDEDVPKWVLGQRHRHRPQPGPHTLDAGEPGGVPGAPLRDPGDLDRRHGSGAQAPVRNGTGGEVLEHEVSDVAPVLVGDPVGSALQLEEVVVAGAVLGGQLGRLDG